LEKGEPDCVKQFLQTCAGPRTLRADEIETGIQIIREGSSLDSWILTIT
jgi:hypothetical protein